MSTSPDTTAGFPVFKDLVRQRREERGWTQSELIERMGVAGKLRANLKLLDRCVRGQEMPPDFLRSLLDALEIDPIEFFRSVQASIEAEDAAWLRNKARKFRPWARVLVDAQFSPWFAYQFWMAQLSFPVDEELRHLPLDEEMARLRRMAREHMEAMEESGSNLLRKVYGLVYHRDPGLDIVFDQDFRVVEFKRLGPPAGSGKQPLGNRMIDLL